LAAAANGLLRRLTAVRSAMRLRASQMFYSPYRMTDNASMAIDTRPGLLMCGDERFSLDRISIPKRQFRVYALPRAKFERAGGAEVGIHSSSSMRFARASICTRSSDNTRAASSTIVAVEIHAASERAGGR